jgi:hypothetical protein
MSKALSNGDANAPNNVCYKPPTSLDYKDIQCPPCIYKAEGHRNYSSEILIYLI